MELIVRGSTLYWFLVLVFRFVLRRDAGSVGLADMLLLVIIADAAQNAMAGEYKTISEGLILVSTIIGWNVMIDRISYFSPRLRRFFEPDKVLLVRDGRIQHRNLRPEYLAVAELMSKLREEGLTM